MFGMAGGSAGQFVVGPLIGSGVSWNTFWLGMGIAGLIIGVILYFLTPSEAPAATRDHGLKPIVQAFAAAGRHTCRNSHVDGFRATHAAFAATILARGAKFSSAAAARAGHVEAHFASGLLNGASPIAC